MAPDGSVTHWIHAVKDGDSAAAQALWERYFAKLVRLARKKLEGTPRRMADEEDVALSALASFCHAAQRGRFPDLADRDGLWRLLLQMTARKAVDQRRREGRQRRGGGKVRTESALVGNTFASEAEGLAQIIGDSPRPEFAAMMAEEFRCSLDQLGDPDLAALALAKMEGYTNEEVAKQLGCSVRTVERRLALIRKKWTQERPS